MINVGIKYICTKSSKDGTFQVGDNFFKYSDGTIVNCNIGGWLKIEDVKEGIEGMEYKVNEEWLKEQIESAQKRLNNLNKLLGEI